MPTTRTVLIRKALAWYHALPLLDGHVETTTIENPKTGDKTTTKKVIPYVFGVEGKGGGKVRWNVAKNLDILKHEYDTFTKARDGMIMEISGGAATIPDTDTASIVKLNQQVEELLDKETTIDGLLNISLADLNLENNPELSPSALAALMDLITE